MSKERAVYEKGQQSGMGNLNEFLGEDDSSGQNFADVKGMITMLPGNVCQIEVACGEVVLSETSPPYPDGLDLDRLRQKIRELIGRARSVS